MKWLCWPNERLNLVLSNKNNLKFKEKLKIILSNFLISRNRRNHQTTPGTSNKSASPFNSISFLSILLRSWNVGRDPSTPLSYGSNRSFAHLTALPHTKFTLQICHTFYYFYYKNLVKRKNHLISRAIDVGKLMSSIKPFAKYNKKNIFNFKRVRLSIKYSNINKQVRAKGY